MTGIKVHGSHLNLSRCLRDLKQLEETGSHLSSVFSVFIQRNSGSIKPAHLGRACHPLAATDLSECGTLELAIGFVRADERAGRRASYCEHGVDVCVPAPT